MSYTELHTGKLRRLSKHNVDFTVEDLQNFLRENENLYVDDIEERIEDGYEFFGVLEKNTKSYDDYKFILNKGVFYEMIEHVDHGETSDIDSTIVDSNGDISFTYMFYNGGTCFSELLEEGLETQGK